jgi:hypothetical protein
LLAEQHHKGATENRTCSIIAGQQCSNKYSSVEENLLADQLHSGAAKKQNNIAETAETAPKKVQRKTTFSRAAPQWCSRKENSIIEGTAVQHQRQISRRQLVSRSASQMVQQKTEQHYGRDRCAAPKTIFVSRAAPQWCSGNRITL